MALCADLHLACEDTQLHLWWETARFLEVWDQLTAHFCGREVPRTALKVLLATPAAGAADCLGCGHSCPCFLLSVPPSHINSSLVKCLCVTLCYCLITLCFLLDLLPPCNTAEVLVHPYSTGYQLQCSPCSVPLFLLCDKTNGPNGDQQSRMEAWECW